METIVQLMISNNNCYILINNTQKQPIIQLRNQEEDLFDDGLTSSD